MKFTEALQLENFTAHYDVIMGNVTVASKELDSLLSSITSANGELADVKDKLALAQDILGKTKESTDILTTELDNRESVISSRELTAKTIVEDAKTIADKMIVEANDRKIILDRQSSELSKEVSSKEDSVRVLSAEVSRLEDKKSILTSNVEDIKRDYVDTDNKLNALLKEIGDTSSQYSLDIATYKKDLSDVIKTLEEEKPKIIIADVYLKQREEDLAIMTRRLQARFSEIMPGVAVKI